MKRLFTLLSIILAFNILSAQEVFHFRSNAPQGLSIESSTATGLSLHYTVPEIGIATIDNGEAKGQEIILKGSFGSFAEGLPNLPAVNQYIAIPQGAKAHIVVTEKAVANFNDIDLLPAAEVQLNRAEGLPKIKRNMDVFGKDANFPSENVAIAQTTQIRGLDVVLLSVVPFRYNPIRKTLEVIYDMDIEVSFEGGNGQFGDPRYLNPEWDNILHDLVINGDMLPEANYHDRVTKAIQNNEEGCEYLIISPDDEEILALADTLKAFRTKQGILTKVVGLEECGGNNPYLIKEYIQNAYEHWAIPPATIMIFGGCHYQAVGNDAIFDKGIFGFLLKFIGYDHGNGNIMDYVYLSDSPYADMNADSIPDIAISRLPANDIEDYRLQVNKIIGYETNPPTDPVYYDNPIVTAGFEDNKWFMITAQSANGFYRDKLGKHPTNLYMVYEHGYEITYPDTLWSTGFNTEAVVNYFGPDGQNYFPRCICDLDNWISSSESHYLVEALDKGSFLTLYRDHCAYDFWCCPVFNDYHIQTMQSAYPTYIFSIGCDTGCYQEIEGGAHIVIPNFCHQPVGALGGIGAVTVTRSHYNDMITWGMLDYFWPEFMPTLGTATRPEFARPTYALVAGKMFLNHNALYPTSWWPNYIYDSDNVFHSLGEAYLTLYTEVPQHMAIVASPYTDSQTQYNITAEEGALICLTHGDDIIAVTHATGQQQSIEFPRLPIGERIIVTITKQNRSRFEQEVTVVDSNQPYVYAQEFLVGSHDDNGQCDAGELVDFDLVLTNNSTIASDRGTVTLISESPYVEMMQNTAHYPSIGPNASITLREAFRIKVASTMPDQTRLRFIVKFNENENTHEDTFDILGNAPIITFNPDIKIEFIDGEPSTHINTVGTTYVTFSLSNTGHSNVSHLSAALDVKAPFVDVVTPPYTELSLATNEEASLTFELNTIPNTLTGAWLQSPLLIQYDECHVCLDTIMQYGCVFEGFETETLNPFFRWTNSGLHKWVYTDDDPYEGRQCLKSNANILSTSTLKAALTAAHVQHHCKVSFRYKTDENDVLNYGNVSNVVSAQFTSKEWQYAEVDYNGVDRAFIWTYKPQGLLDDQAKLDNICFPPLHTAIASAGDDMVACAHAPVVLNDAYAYYCNTVQWSTDGDGYFEQYDILNATYIPGGGDITDGSVTLTLTAIGNESHSDSIHIQFVDGILLESIVGDSIVNKYEQPMSHYATGFQEGVHYLWQLEPASAGSIYDYGNAIDILWNLADGDEEVTLTVTADNGCDMEPIAKTISLIGTSVSEWHATDFDLFPNPTDGKVNLVFGESLQGKAVIEVYNLLGERMLVQTASQRRQGETISLDLSKMVSGLYIIKLSTENGSCSKKVSVW